MPNEKAVLKKILHTFGTKIMAAAIQFMIAVIISQTLGDAGKGTQSLLLTTITFILIFSDIVSGESIVFLTPRHPFRHLLVPSVIWSALTAGVMGGLLPFVFHTGLDSGQMLHVAMLAFLAPPSRKRYGGQTAREIYRPKSRLHAPPFLKVQVLYQIAALGFKRGDCWKW